MAATATGPAFTFLKRYINGKPSNAYSKFGKPASYRWHSSCGDFQYDGDAWWTNHRLDPGENLRLAGATRFESDGGRSVTTISLDITIYIDRSS